MRNPYEIYAKFILKLKPLNKLEDEFDQSDYGTLVHKILERFNNAYPSQLDENAKETLSKISNYLPPKEFSSTFSFKNSSAIAAASAHARGVSKLVSLE